MKDLIRRLPIACGMIALVAFFLTFGYVLYVYLALVVLCALLSAIATWEYAECARSKGSHNSSKVLAGCSFLLTLCFPFFRGDFFASIVLAMLIAMALAHFRKVQNSLLDLAVALFALVYITVPVCLLVGLAAVSLFWTTYLIVLTKGTDMAAYFGGKALGKHPLAPTISPKKSWEGALVGLAFSLIASYCFFRYSPLHFYAGEWVILGIVLGVLGQIGDLLESLLKRDAGKKDSNSLPGVGGVLDMLDSLLLTTPALCLYMLLTRSY